MSALSYLGLWGLSGFLNDLQLWDLNVLGHLVDLLIDDGLLSLHSLLDDFVHLCFNCVDDVLNMRVHNLFRLFSHLSDRHLNDLLSE